jgi:UDP-N-acetylglucosamine--dolichyl-phosphate N-acetylglucosaminephosphotransferase
MMPKIIKFMKRRKITGIDVHKLDKPVVAEMGGAGLLIGITIGCTILFFVSGFLGFFDYRILVFLAVVILAGVVGIIDDLKTLGPKIKPLLTAIACIPLWLSFFVRAALGAPIPPPYDPRPRLPFLGSTRLTIIYHLIVPFGIAVPANAVNMLDVFNGVMPLTTIFFFVAMLIVSIIMVGAGIPGAELGILLSSVMLGALFAYYYFNRYPAKTFAGDTGALSVGAAIGALAIMGQLEIVAIVALLPAIMNAFFSLASIGGLLERRQMKSRPTIFREDGTLAASHASDAPMTLTRLVLAGGPLKEQNITMALATLSLASSILAILSVFLIPFETIGYLIQWPVTLILGIIPVILLIGVYLVYRGKDNLGIRLTGLIAIMITVWIVGMAVFSFLDLLVALDPPPGLELAYQIFQPIAGMILILGWLILWQISTRLYFRYQIRRAPSLNS